MQVSLAAAGIACTIVLIGTVQNSTLCRAPDDERLDSFETCRVDKKLWNKFDYKNCGSRWSLTHCNMMHGRHNVKLNSLRNLAIPRLRLFSL